MDIRRVFFVASLFAVAASTAAQDPSPNYFGDISALKLLKPEDKEDVKSTPPPEGAIVLFDGKSLDGWVRRDNTNEKAHWKLVDGGAMQVHREGKKQGDIITAKTFDGHFKLHVEFRIPYQPNDKGQGRGNSGVYVQGRYEVQVLDSYGIPKDKLQQNDCGSIYGVAVAKENACKAPTVWQSYDIEFWSPKCENGKKTEPGRITVLHNGTKIHDEVTITKDVTTAGLPGDPCTPGPILLQDHGNPVQYRNIWLVQLK
jgi:3-keto-disaccharide hydrolase